MLFSEFFDASATPLRCWSRYTPATKLFFPRALPPKHSPHLTNVSTVAIGTLTTCRQTSAFPSADTTDAAAAPVRQHDPPARTTTRLRTPQTKTSALHARHSSHTRLAGRGIPTI